MQQLLHPEPAWHQAREPPVAQQPPAAQQRAPGHAPRRRNLAMQTLPSPGRQHTGWSNTLARQRCKLCTAKMTSNQTPNNLRPTKTSQGAPGRKQTRWSNLRDSLPCRLCSATYHSPGRPGGAVRRSSLRRGARTAGGGLVTSSQVQQACGVRRCKHACAARLQCNLPASTSPAAAHAPRTRTEP